MRGNRMDNIKVFISSVVEEYEHYRVNVAEAIERLNSDNEFNIKPVRIEKLPEVEEFQQSACLDALVGCAIFLGIYGKRYGQKDSSDALSQTHTEFRKAKAENKRILVFVEDIPDEEREPEQRVFLKEVADHITSSEWNKFKIVPDPKDVYQALNEEYQKLEEVTLNKLSLDYADVHVDKCSSPMTSGREEKILEHKKKYWSKELEKRHPNINAVFKAFEDSRDPTCLLIVVDKKKGELDMNIHFFTKQFFTEHGQLVTTKIMAKIFEEIGQNWNGLGDKVIDGKKVISTGRHFQEFLLMGYLFSVDEAELGKSLGESEELKAKIEEIFRTRDLPLSKVHIFLDKKDGEYEIEDGKNRYIIKQEDKKLNIYLRDENDSKLNMNLRSRMIHNGRDRMCEVWIDCKDELIQPLWEWIYTNEGFFWGDMFHIVRIPENCDFEKSNFKIGKVAILPYIQDKSSSWADDESIHIESRTGIKPEEILLNSPEIEDLNDFNCIHVVADAEHKIIESSVRNAKTDKCTSEPSDFNRLNSPKILFLNILNPSIKCDFRAKMITLLPAKMCIRTILTVQEDFAQKFADCFYECVVKETNVAIAIRKAREKIQKCDDVDDCTKFCRFAYVVCGNPYTRITWNDN